MEMERTHFLEENKSTSIKNRKLSEEDYYANKHDDYYEDDEEGRFDFDDDYYEYMKEDVE